MGISNRHFLNNKKLFVKLDKTTKIFRFSEWNYLLCCMDMIYVITFMTRSSNSADYVVSVSVSSTDSIFQEVRSACCMLTCLPTGCLHTAYLQELFTRCLPTAHPSVCFLYPSACILHAYFLLSACQLHDLCLPAAYMHSCYQPYACLILDRCMPTYCTWRLLCACRPFFLAVWLSACRLFLLAVWLSACWLFLLSVWLSGSQSLLFLLPVRCLSTSCQIYVRISNVYAFQ